MPDVTSQNCLAALRPGGHEDYLPLTAELLTPPTGNMRCQHVVC